MTDSGELSILLLEDSPFDVFLLRTNLARLFGAGFSLLHVERLKDALTLLRKNPVDVILTDLNLPDSFGPETVRALVRDAKGIPVVALVGDNTPGLEEELMHEGTSGQVSKDEINTPVFDEVISRTLHRSRQDDPNR